MRRRSNRSRRGITLIEVLVALAVLALVASLVYGAFDAMSRTRTGVEGASERYHQGRSAVSRMSREIQSAFLSMHRPLQNPGLQVSQTIFKGTDGGTTGDRLDFTSFSHRRLGFGSHESDQNELSYFITSGNRARTAKGGNVDTLDLARREATIIDMEPTTGGVSQILAEDVVEFDLQYMDGTTGDWLDHWDSSAEQFERLPRYVRIELAIARNVPGVPYRFVTKVPIAMRAPLIFGLPEGLGLVPSAQTP
ncbi:MAG: prepilin-type N-terminal cleavage/methylation domain-containing protein [Polyangiaceae bacterium]|nr:prepilin-type N-terminal cleavage/methylation domain-containing protein [Polyangiaceae bacterium]